MADKFLDFIDMIDGGGAGKFGKEFEGGGIFSVLANALATPYGSEDEERMRKLRQMRGLLAPDESIAPKAAPRPTVTRGGGAGRAQVRPQARPSQSMPFGSTPVGGGMPAAPSMTFGNIPVGGGMPAAQNYESTLKQALPHDHPVSYRSQHRSEAVSDAYDREMALAEALGISPEEAEARYYAQKHMAYPQIEMEYLTDPEDGYAGIPNIERLMPPVNAAPQAPQGIPVQPYQAKQVPPSLQLDPIPKYAETLDRMKQELGEEKYKQILMSPNFTQILQMYERGGPMR
jgi:hypothetical protein